MLDIIKLILISIIILLFSKSLGDNLNNKWKLPFKSMLGLGYLCNIAIFFVILLPVLIFKLSYIYLLIFGCIYLIINIVSLYFSFKNKTLFKFNKIDIIILGCSIFLMILYFYCLDFGTIETYDSYFYSTLTNNAVNSKAISVVDPYTGLSNMQNFYKYMSYYYMSSFYGGLFNVSHAYLVLIWSFTFMNFILIFNTAFTVCRISKRKAVNNILSIFYLTIILSLFRAPFNALHLTTFVISIYIFRFSFHLFKGKINSIYYLLICIIASMSFTSTSLFTLLPFIFILFITNSILREQTEYKYLFVLALPVILLGGLYMYESLKTIYVLVVLLIFCSVILYSFKYKWFNIAIRYLCYVLAVLMITLFIFAKQLGVEEFIKNTFMKSSALSADEIVETSNVKTCLGNNSIEILDNNIMYDNEDGMGSAIKYIMSDGDTTLTKITILLTHSIPKYGGLLFLLIYGFFYRRKQYSFIAFISYMILFNNPLVSNGINIVTMGLSSRIVLFFNTYFAFIGLKYFFEYIFEMKEKFKWNLNLIPILKVGSYLMGGCLIVSIVSYAYNIKPKGVNDYNYLYKMPNSLVKLEKEMNQLNLQSEDNHKPRFFYTESVFNVTMIDTVGENKINIMNSKEYMNFFGEETKINDKIMINNYFESEGKYGFEKIVSVCQLIEFEELNPAECSCNIQDMFKLYTIDYLVTKKPDNEEFYKNIKELFEITFENAEYMIIQQKGESYEH